MEALDTLKSKLIGIKVNILSLIAEVIEENSSLIEDLNISQLEKGQRADGVTLPNYSRTSVMKFGKPAGPIKLFDKGDYYKSITLKVFDKYFESTNTDSKDEELRGRYGDEILGISDDNQQIIIDTILLPELQKKVNEQLLL